jgi:integrase
MAATSFKFELNHRPKADGTCAILLRITHNRKLRRIGLGYSVLPEDWNAERQEVRRSHPLFAQINMAMQIKLNEVQKESITAVAANRPLTARQLQKKINKEVMGESYLEYAHSYIAELANASTQLSRESMINKLEAFLGSKKDLHFDEISYDFLKKYERYLKKIGNGVNTIHGNMKFLKTVYNDALARKIFRTSDNPWIDYSTKTEKAQRVRLKPLQIEKIETFESNPGSRMFDAKNMFLFSFYIQGMRVSDLLQLRWRDIKGDYITYKANKTSKARPRKLISKAKVILDYYRSSKQAPTDYIFPLLRGYNKADFTPKQWVKKIDSKNSLIRKELMIIAEKLGFEKLTMHIARHSFANIARKITGDIHVVSDALDHSSISITERYFDDGAAEENDDLVFKIFGE